MADNNDVRDALKKAAAILADKARELFSDWSKSAPPTVKVTTRGQTVKVVAGSPDAPAAYFAAKPRNRAPAWANRKSPWHFTGYHDSLSEAAELTLDEVSAAFTDDILPKLTTEYLGK